MPPLHPAGHLEGLLARIDGRGYKAYRDLRGGHALDDDVALYVDHVQGDPFAAPSRVRLRVAMERAALPPALSANPVRALALRDALARRVRETLVSHGARAGSAGSGRSGLVAIDAGAQEVIERTAIVLRDAFVEARLEVGLPASGRRVLGSRARELLVELLGTLAQQALCWGAFDAPAREGIRRFVDCIENQQAIRARLADRGLVAFVADGSLLPRESGASDRPLRPEQAVTFRAPDALAVRMPLPNPLPEPFHPAEPGAGGADGCRSLRGLAVREGVTLIVGGGYHGKTTLLRALERGIHPHVPGDGREYVVSAPELVKVRAEDGRSVAGVDIHAFVRELPRGPGTPPRSTRAFSTADASGSTSQAANIAEALEAGARGLLIDEDTSATNFMVRDARMQALIAREAEPITPFVERVREAWEQLGVSSVLVMGGCGDYLDVADTVVAMRDYVPSDATQRARAVASEIPSARRRDATEPLHAPADRIPLPSSFDAVRGRREPKIAARDRERLDFGNERIDLRGLEQLLDASQTRAIGGALWLASREWIDAEHTLAEILDALEARIDASGLDGLDPRHRPGAHPGRLARPRRFEVAAALGRMRSLRVRQRASRAGADGADARGEEAEA